MRGCLVLILFPLLAACGGNMSNSAANHTLANSSSLEPSGVAQTVTIDSRDGVKLVGSLYPALKPASPTLLLLHQWQSDRHSYDDFAERMQKRGFCVLSIDGRGFGESTKRADGTTVTAERTDTAVKGMLGDVDAAVQFLKEQPNVNVSRVGIVGASYGSSLALIYAADHPNITAVALLSPGLNYFGNLPTEPAVKKYDDRDKYKYGARRLFFLAAEDDKESVDAVRKLNPMVVDNYLYPEHIFASGGHGTALLNVGAAEDLGNFFAVAFDLANLHLKP